MFGKQQQQQQQKHKPFKRTLNLRFVVVGGGGGGGGGGIFCFVLFKSDFPGHFTCSAQRACVTLASVELVPRTLFNSVHQPIRDRRRGGVKLWLQTFYHVNLPSPTLLSYDIWRKS